MVETIIAGDSKSWRVRLRAIAQYRDAPENVQVAPFIRTCEGRLVELAGEFKDGMVTVTLSPEASSELPNGPAYLVFRATSEELGYQRSAVIFPIEVHPSLEAEDFDHRTTAQRMLALAEAALEKYTTSGGRVRSYTIGTRQLTFSSAQEIIDLVKYWRYQVHLEACAAAGRDPRKALVEFV